MTFVVLDEDDVLEFFCDKKVSGFRKDLVRLWKGVKQGSARVIAETLQAAVAPTEAQAFMQAGGPVGGAGGAASAGVVSMDVRIAIDMVLASQHAENQKLQAAQHAETEKRITEKFNACLKSRDDELNVVLSKQETLEARVKSAEAKVMYAGLGQVEALQEERDAAVEQCAAMEGERDRAVEQRDAIQEERDEMVEQRNEMVEQRNEMEEQRDGALKQLDRAEDEHDAMKKDRDAMQKERDEAVEQRDAVKQELARVRARYNKAKSFFTRDDRDDEDDAGDNPRSPKRPCNKAAHDKRAHTKSAHAKRARSKPRKKLIARVLPEPGDRYASARECLECVVKETPDADDIVWVTDIIKVLLEEEVGKVHHDHVHRLMRDVFTVEAEDEMPEPPKPQRVQKGFRGFRIMDASERAQRRQSLGSAH